MSTQKGTLKMLRNLFRHLTFLALALALSVSTASSRSKLEIKVGSGKECAKICAGMLQAECNMAYFNSISQFCRITTDTRPNQVGARYIYSRQLNKRLNKADIQKYWPKAKCRWTSIGIGDVAHHDVGKSAGRLPQTNRCTLQIKGTGAVCWAKGMSGSNGPWCTYKNIPAYRIVGGSNPGSRYECSCR